MIFEKRTWEEYADVMDFFRWHGKVVLDESPAGG
jgi:hypothetical protein